MKQRELSHSRGTVSHTTSDTTEILLYSSSFPGAGGWFQSTSHQHLKSEIQKARRPEYWDWIKPLFSPDAAFWEGDVPSSFYTYDCSLPMAHVLKHLEDWCFLVVRMQIAIKYLHSFIKKSSSSFFKVPYLVLNLLLMVKDTAVSYFNYLFIQPFGKLTVVIWNTFPPMTATFNLFEWAISPFWRFCCLINMMLCDWGGNVISHGRARITRFF